MQEDFNEMCEIMTDYMQVGFMEAMKAYEPVQDEVRLSKVKEWLRFMRFDTRKFNILVKQGAIKATRKGGGRNSPLYYSKADIKLAFANARLCGMVSRRGGARGGEAAT